MRHPYRLLASAALLASAGAIPSPAQLMAAIQGAASAGEADYVVPSGVYNFSSLNFALSGATSFSLDFSGSTLLFTPGFGMHIYNASNLTLSQLYLDNDPLFFTQGIASGIARSSSDYIHFDVSIEGGYPLPDASFFQGQNAKVIFWDGGNRTILHAQVETTATVHNISNTGVGTYRVYSYLVGPLANFTPPEGCMVTISPVAVAHAVQCNNCSDSTFLDVTVYGSGSMGYLEVSGGGGNVLQRWRNVRLPNSTRLMATSIDGIHSTSVMRGLTLIDSEISFAGDDLFAVHCELGIAWGMMPDSNPATIYVIDTGGSDARTVAHANQGDELFFYALNETMDPLGTGIVRGIAVIDNATLQAEAANCTADIRAQLGIVMRQMTGQTLLLRINFTAPLDAAILPRFSSLVQYNGRCGAGTRVVNTLLHDTTGGMRLKSHNVTVDNVSISRSYGMRMLPEVFWTQSTSANVSITNCVFSTCGDAPAQEAPIAWNNDTCPGLILSNNTFLP